mgnify:CR=1 FL=1
MNISMYEVVYKSERLSGDKTNAKGLICAHSNEEALFLAEDLIRSIKEKMKDKEEDNDI